MSIEVGKRMLNRKPRIKHYHRLHLLKRQTRMKSHLLLHLKVAILRMVAAKFRKQNPRTVQLNGHPLWWQRSNRENIDLLRGMFHRFLKMIILILTNSFINLVVFFFCRRRNYENRRVGPSYPRKDSGSYSTSSKRNVPPSSSGKSSTKKESEKYDDGAAIFSSRGEL